MPLELIYNPESDRAVYLRQPLRIDGHGYDISVGTSAGRRQLFDSEKPNEDAFGVVSYEHGITAAVFDGASSQKPIPELDGISGARFASHSLKEMFEARNGGEEVSEMLQALNQLFGEKLKTFTSVDYTDLNSLPTSTATIAQIDTQQNRLNISHVGDSFVAVLRANGTTELLTDNRHRPYDEEVLTLIRRIADETGATNLEARKDPRVDEAIMAMFQNTRNRPDGTGEGMLNGDPNMNQYIYPVSIPLSGERVSAIQAVLLGSDGLVPPDMDEQNPEHRERMFDILRYGGIKALIKRTRSAEHDDPDRRHVRYKHADDATGILLSIVH